METKVCTKCGDEKVIKEFGVCNHHKDKLTSFCKLCLAEYARMQYYKHKKTNNARSKKYKKNNKEKIKKYNKEYKKENKEKIDIKTQAYKTKNRDKIKKWNSDYHTNRLKNDVLFRLSHNLRSSLTSSFKHINCNKNSKTSTILGCSYKDFKNYLESKFEPWMTWDNYGKYNGELNFGWDIDHIIPLSKAQSKEELIKLNYYTNLQPLDSKFNREVKRNNFN